MKSSLFQGLVLLASLLLSFSPPLGATPPPDPQLFGATITFPDGTTTFLRARDRFRPISLSPGASITIAFQLPAAFANQPAVAQALDGGRLDAEDVTISPVGTASLTFQTGSAPGNYRLLLSSRGRSANLSFTVSAP